MWRRIGVRIEARFGVWTGSWGVEPVDSGELICGPDGEDEEEDEAGEVDGSASAEAGDAPDVDQQLNQAQAMLEQAKTNLALAKVTAPRYQELIKSNSVSQQEVDQANQNLAAQEANVQAAAAALGRLEQMQGFEKVVAPFDGVITERKTDFGDLINAVDQSFQAAVVHFHDFDDGSEFLGPAREGALPIADNVLSE